MSANDPAAPSGQGRPMSAEPIEGCKYCGKPGWKAVGGGYICSACASSPAPTSPAVPEGRLARILAASMLGNVDEEERLLGASPAVPSGEQMRPLEHADVFLQSALHFVGLAEDGGSTFEMVPVRSDIESARRVLAALRAAQPGEADLNELAERILLVTDRLVVGDGGKRYGPKILALLRESLHAAQPAWKVPCPVCEGRGVLKEAVSGWDVGEPAPTCTYCNDGVLDLEALLWKRAAPSPTDEPASQVGGSVPTGPQETSNPADAGHSGRVSPTALPSPTDASTEARERTNELMQPEAHSRLRLSLQRFRDHKGRGLKGRDIALLAEWLLPLAATALTRSPSEQPAPDVAQGRTLNWTCAKCSVTLSYAPEAWCPSCGLWLKNHAPDAPPPASEPDPGTLKPAAGLQLRPADGPNPGTHSASESVHEPGDSQ